jgi:hypothetical protein
MALIDINGSVSRRNAKLVVVSVDMTCVVWWALGLGLVGLGLVECLWVMYGR